MDWNRWGKTQFKIDVLFIGLEWKNQDKRIKKQNSLINQLPINERYNNPDSHFIYRQPVEIDDEEFDSIAQAALILHVSETTIRRRLNSSKFSNYRRKKVIKGCSVSIEGTVYPSIIRVVEMGLAKNRIQVYRRLNSKSAKWQDWFYIDEKRKV